MIFYYNNSNGLVCNEPIDFANFGIVTQVLSERDKIDYGGPFLIAESMNLHCAKMICKLLSGEWSDTPLINKYYVQNLESIFQPLVKQAIIEGAERNQLTQVEYIEKLVLNDIPEAD